MANCFCGRKAPLFARLRGWVKDEIDMWYCPEHKSRAFRSPRCSQCRRELKLLGSDFAMMMAQYEGTVCEKCRKIRCDRCHPPSRANICPTCDGKLLPAFAQNLRG